MQSRPKPTPSAKIPHEYNLLLFVEKRSLISQIFLTSGSLVLHTTYDILNEITNALAIVKIAIS